MSCLYHDAPPPGAEEEQKDSKYARAAERLVRNYIFYPPCTPFLVTESKFLGGKLGALDFSVPVLTPWGLRWVHVEVDGETHFTKPRQGESVWGQRERDRRKDAAAWEQKQMLVRLHHGDWRAGGGEQPEWEAALQRAFQLAWQERPHRFLILSKSFSQLAMQDEVEAL